MNNKNFKTTMIIAIVAIIAAVGVGYAALATNLTINGTGTVKASSWEIKFANLSDANLIGKAQEITKPTISNNDTHIGNYAVTLNKPGDSVEYTFDVVNSGTLDAEISSVTVSGGNCTGNGAEARQDEAKVCEELLYDLTYADGTAVARGDALQAGETKNMKLVLTYDAADLTPDRLPKNDVTISNLDVTVVYSQK